MKFRTLRADEIDVRVGTAKENGVSLLLYKDARCDMNILDEEVGPLNWKRSHSRDNANCTVSIWDADKREWISKEDTGTDSNTEAEKGRASDSFKRACVNWGIGRELYTSPFIWVDSENCKVEKRNDRWVCNTKFTVAHIDYDDDRNINSLEIVNENTGKTVYLRKVKKAKKAQNEPSKEAEKEPESKPSTTKTYFAITALCKKYKLKLENEAVIRGIEPLGIETRPEDLDKLHRELLKACLRAECDRIHRGVPRMMEYYGIDNYSPAERLAEVLAEVQAIKTV